MSANNSTKPSTISHGTTNSGRNSVLILPDDYKFKGDGSDSHRWREIKDQVLNKAMSGQGFKMSLLETKPVPDEDIYKNSTGVFTISGKIALEKKKEEIDKDQMKVFGILIKHIEPNSRAWAIIGDLVKDSDPVAVYKKLKDTYDADSTAGFFEMIEKFYDPPGEEDLLHFLNRKYKELYDFESFGKTSSIDEDGLTVEETPHKISETVKVLTVFALARKIQKYAIEMDDFVTEHLLNLQFDSVDLKFSILYEKLVKFLRNREITGAKAAESKDPAVFTTELFQVELNRALQRRENNNRRKEFKKKKLLGRRPDKFGKPALTKPKNWFCSIHGNQPDHSSQYCPTLHPELLERKSKFTQPRNNPNSNPLHRVKDEEKELEANVTLSKKPRESRDVKFEWGVNFITVSCNLTAADEGSVRCIYDTGAGANVLNRFQRKLIRNFQPCDGNIIGAGGRIVGAIVGVGTIVVLGQEMPVYYGPDLPKSVFSIGVFTRDYGFEIWFKGNLCITWLPKHTIRIGRPDYEIISVGEDTLYDMPIAWFN